MQNPSDPEKIHCSPFKGFLPFFWLALAVLGGTWLADQTALPCWAWAVGLATSLVLWGLAKKLPAALNFTQTLIRLTRADCRLPGAVLAAFFFLAGWRCCAAQPELMPEWVGFYNERGVVQLVGEVVQAPDVRDTHTNLIVRVEALTLLEDGVQMVGPGAISGKVLVQVVSGGDWAYGDHITARGQLETPFETESFSYRDYLARKGILSIMPYASAARTAVGEGRSLQAWLYVLREKSLAVLHRIFPSPEADLLAGILLGLDQGLSPDLQEAFRKTGTSHIIAISGFNMTILAGLFASVFTRLFGRKWGVLASILGIALYTLFVGGEAPVVRAAIIGALGVIGGMFGRRQNGLNSLGLAVFVMVLLNPNLPWDIGFQLSAAATLGLVLYAQPLEERGIQLAQRWLTEDQARKVIGPVSDFLLFTLAAQVMTLPIIVYHFGGLSWITLLANPLILPPQPMVLILGGLALLAGLVLPGLGRLLAILALPFVRYTVRMVTWLGALPGGDFGIPNFHPLWLVAFYGVLFGLTLFPREAQRQFLSRIRPARVGLLVLAGLTFFVWNRALTRPDDRLHLTLLDDDGTIWVQAPGGGTVLIGGGSSPATLRQRLGEHLSSGPGVVEWAVIASPSREDLNALQGEQIIKRIGRVLWGLDPAQNMASRVIYETCGVQKVPISALEAGHSLALGDDITLEVLALEEDGAVLWLEYGRFSALLPTGKVGESWLKVPAAPDVVLLPDDISASALPLAELNRWSPAVILLSLKDSQQPLQGEPELVSLLAGYPLVTTLEHDWVKVSTDGVRLWVEAAR